MEKRCRFHWIFITKALAHKRFPIVMEDKRRTFVHVYPTIGRKGVSRGEDGLAARFCPYRVLLSVKPAIVKIKDEVGDNHDEVQTIEEQNIPLALQLAHI